VWTRPKNFVITVGDRLSLKSHELKEKKLSEKKHVFVAKFFRFFIFVAWSGSRENILIAAKSDLTIRQSDQTNVDLPTVFYDENSYTQRIS